MGDTRIVVDAMGGDYAPEWIIRGQNTHMTPPR